MRCPNCEAEILENERNCRSCDVDIGFLNVRFAQKREEHEALEKRMTQALAAVDARGCRDVFDRFVQLCGESKVVIARSISVLDNIINNDYEFMVSFHRQVESGIRRHEQNSWDRNRINAEQLVNPFCFKDIIFGALSTDGCGLLAWGRYSINLKEVCISHRATVFEENVFNFHRKHNVVGGSDCPLGFRADWSRRGVLAGVKLNEDFSTLTNVDDFSKVLLKQGTNRGDADFVEVHICGRIHRSAIERVIARLPIPRADKPIWTRVKRTAKDLDVIVEEV